MNKHERFFGDREASRREILTPEGVLLSARLADPADRAVAFIIDACIWSLLLLLLFITAAMFSSSKTSTGAIVSLLLLAAFIIRNTYFLHFELAWQGSTPGKRIVGLRVVDRNGGPLLPWAVIARNLTREIEIFLPLGICLSLGSAPAHYILWAVLMVALPLLTKDRMRAGDLIAGTMVIVLPRRGLAADLAEGDFQYRFSDQHLKAYGAFELQVLEELLRNVQKAESTELMRTVGEKIRHKIGWTQQVPPEHELHFLRDFYAAERRFLETQQLFGRLS